VASFSDGTHYVNRLLINTDNTFNSDFTDPSHPLTQVWNFADATNLTHVPPFDNRLKPLIAQTVQVITYYDPTKDTSSKPHQIRFRLPPPSWTSYPQTPPLEVPPLPDKSDTHHLVRDFMFLHAARHRRFSSTGGPPSIKPSSPFQVHSIDLPDPISDPEGGDYPVGALVSHGTGSKSTTDKMLVDATTVSDNGTLGFSNAKVNITLKLYELLDGHGDVAKVAPNWFGVAIPVGVTDFSKPIIYFHPTPGQNAYNDDDYPLKTTGPKTYSGRDWRELFAYLDRLGNQLAGAVQAGAIPNQIVIMPFMTSNLANDANLGIFRANWLAIVTDILRDISTM